MPEEYTGPKRCDLCKHEDNAPCNDKKCGIMHDYDAFEPKGTDSQEAGCPTCNNWKAVKIGKFCPDCGGGFNLTPIHLKKEVDKVNF